MNWKQKLTSRKFWIAVIGFVTPLLLAFGKSESDVTQISSIIMAGGTLIAYIIGEGFIDASNLNSNDKPENNENNKEEK